MAIITDPNEISRFINESIGKRLQEASHWYEIINRPEPCYPNEPTSLWLAKNGAGIPDELYVTSIASNIENGEPHITIHAKSRWFDRLPNRHFTLL